MKKISLFFLVAIISAPIPAAMAQTVAHLANRNLKVVAESRGARVVFKLQTPTGSDVLVAGPPRENDGSWQRALRPELSSRLAGKDEAFFFTSAELISKSRTLRFSGGSKNLSLTRDVNLMSDYPAAYVIDKWQIGPAAKVEALLASFNFAPRGKNYSDVQPLDFIWTPNLRPQPNDLIADHVFRSPAIMLQKDSIFVALIPDLSHLVKHRVMPMAMDFQLPQKPQPDSTAQNDSTRQALSAIIDAAPVLSFGFWPWQARAGAYYQPDSTRAPNLQDREISCAYYLWLESRATPFARASFEKSKHLGNFAFRRVVDFFWDKFSPRYRDGNIGPLPATLDALAQRAWKQYADKNWFEMTINKRPVGGIKNGPLANSNELPAEINAGVWFTQRSQTLRSAYGMYHFGKRNREALPLQRAEKILNLALSAPNENGIFPSIYYAAPSTPNAPLNAAVLNLPDKKAPEQFTPHWTNYNGDDYFQTLDAASTGYWLLRWADLLPPRRQEIFSFCRKYADFIVQQQLSNGAIPSRFHRANDRPRAPTLGANAATAGAAFFLVELYSRTKEQWYLDAAGKAMDYVTREILPHNKWLDFETLSADSSESSHALDDMTGQYPQSTLAMDQAAKAYLALFQNTKSETYLQLGQHALNYLLLHQQVWSPPHFSRNLFGGFGAQNNDAVWSDARQAYFAETLMDYFDATSKRAYFERAIAAMRATFALFHRDSPMCYAQWAPNGGDRPGPITSLNEGTGSAATTFELLRERTGDAYVFAGEKPSAGGANALWIENLRVKNDSIRFNILSSVPWGRSVWIKFFDVAPGKYRLKINDGAVIPFTDVLLKRSIYMPSRRVPVAAHLPPKYFYSRSFGPLPISLKVSGAKPDFTAQLHLRAEPANKSGKANFQTIPLRANFDKSAWMANVPEVYKKDGARFQYYITWNRAGKAQRLPAAIDAEEFYSGAAQPFMLADCGDDNETYLREENDSWISDFIDSRAVEHGRVAEGDQWFSYVFFIQPATQRVKLTFSASGACRVVAGDVTLLTEDLVEKSEIKEHTFTLDDAQLWAMGKLALRFSDANPKDGEETTIGWIKVEELDKDTH